jgi:uncharacterized membrane protein YhdT
MKKAALAIAMLILVLTGCSTTFGGTVFVITMGDVFVYIFTALLIALLIGAVSNKGRRSFWLWFILSLIITPLAGLIYLLIKVTASRKPTGRAS